MQLKPLKQGLQALSFPKPAQSYKHTQEWITEGEDKGIFPQAQSNMTLYDPLLSLCNKARPWKGDRTQWPPEGWGKRL